MWYFQDLKQPYKSEWLHLKVNDFLVEMMGLYLCCSHVSSVKLFIFNWSNSNKGRLVNCAPQKGFFYTEILHRKCIVCGFLGAFCNRDQKKKRSLLLLPGGCCWLLSLAVAAETNVLHVSAWLNIPDSSLCRWVPVGPDIYKTAASRLALSVKGCLWGWAESQLLTGSRHHEAKASLRWLLDWFLHVCVCVLIESTVLGALLPQRGESRVLGVVLLVMTGLYSNWCLLIQLRPFAHVMHADTQACRTLEPHGSWKSCRLTWKQEF